MADRQKALFLECTEAFTLFDVDGNGSIDEDELTEAFKMLDIKLPRYQVRQYLEKFDTRISDGKLDLTEFVNLCMALKEEFDPKFKEVVREARGTTKEEGASGSHSVTDSEQIAYANWINQTLSNDDKCLKYLPLAQTGENLYENCTDGILLCKLVNSAVPGTIDERAMNFGKLNVFKELENLELAINSAQAIGVNVINIHPEHFKKLNKTIILGLVWQIIRIGLLQNINLESHPGLYLLKRDDESMEDFLKLSPEEILMRWMNYHLERAGTDQRVRNLSEDIKSSEAYIHLIKEISPKDKGVNTNALTESDLLKRAEAMLKETEKIDCRRFVSSKDVVLGVHKLNLAFVANLFNNYPALDKEEVIIPDEDNIIRKETREEKTYRNWMNSLGVDPFVYHLYSDLSSGLILFQLYDIIQPGIVTWKRVHKTFRKLKATWEKIENCGYAVELGKQIKLVLVGIGAEDIYNGNETLTMGLVWQLMRAYTLTVLTKCASTGHPIVDEEIIKWANKKLVDGGKNKKFTSFNDSALSDGTVIIDLIECIRPGSIMYDQVNTSAAGHDAKLLNAQYAVSVARKIGAKVYALPEDIVECKNKMILTMFACLMIVDFNSENFDLKQLPIVEDPTSVMGGDVVE